MRNSLVKKLRKEVNRKVITDLEDMITVLRKESFIWRVVVAFRIVFKWSNNVRFGNKGK